jgi:hypothetical protein
MTQTTLEQAVAGRDAAMQQIDESDFVVFRKLAQAFIVAYLRKHGDSPGETITDACKQAGIVPRDDRHFGAAFIRLSKCGIIHKVGTCLRRKGQATSGGNVWGLTEQEEVK